MWIYKNRKCNVNTWWWNSGAKDKIQKKKEAYKEMKKNPTEKTQDEYRRLKKATKKAVARAIKINYIGKNTNNVFRFFRKMKIEK